ncbi:AraC family transcriptional regulator ligand-binding domain-containing protein [Nocardia seriolae]|uniref:AraC family transcriptional regulator ligand-binding domain-containing protein n=1 Tax=Nocardia seriolae TaxID=37332 RepID=UPI001D16E0B9|nr:AraC family transcriptional regulator ligand-binding domain-containing protein [Nocardia seriolae]WNJ57127.1 AraC family transcriptional regulator ligand-binding domain-containing protein [Nocardia seriolae]
MAGGTVETTYRLSLHRFVVSQLSGNGIDADWLLGEVGIPEWTMDDGDIQVPSSAFTRLWEVAAKAVDDPILPVRLGCRFTLGAGGLCDYLFSTSPTIGEGLATVGPYISDISTNHRLSLIEEGNGDIKFGFEIIEGDDRARDLTHLWAVASLLGRPRRVAAGTFDAELVRLRQRAPRTYTDMYDLLGTRAIEFGAAEDSITFRAADMDVPLTTADPVLHGILEKVAATVPPPPALASAWVDQVAGALAEALIAGDASLDAVARRLMVGRRTLQRRLAEAGTTWRQELDRARLERLRRVDSGGAHLGPARQAEILGYAGPQSIRRAARRWESIAERRVSDAIILAMRA